MQALALGTHKVTLVADGPVFTGMCGDCQVLESSGIPLCILGVDSLAALVLMKHFQVHWHHLSVHLKHFRGKAHNIFLFLLNVNIT